MVSDRNRKLHIVITIAVMVFIFVQSALPGDLSGAESNIIVDLLHELTGLDAEALSLFVRKTAHFTEFMILGACLAVNVRDHAEGTGRVPGLPDWIAAWIIGTAYAATDELHQSFVPDRACAFTDVCIDSAGVAAGVIIAAVICSRLARAQKRQ